jgi:hypothetical protein
MTEQKLFPLPAPEEVKEVLKIEDRGEVYKLMHVFRGLTAADKKAFWGHIGHSELSGPAGGQGGDYLGAVEKLYDCSIKRVEGYDLPEGTENWRELIPLEHKAWAVGRLLKSAGTLSEEAQKN